MDELRWALLLLGIIVVLAVYLYSRHQSNEAKSRLGTGSSGADDRAEPMITGEDLWGADEDDDIDVQAAAPPPPKATVEAQREPRRGLAATRREPSIGDAAPDEAQDAEPDSEPLPNIETEPVAAQDPGPPIDPEKIVAMRMAARAGNTMPAEALVLKLRELGLRHGKFGIFHRHRPDADGPPLFSVASMTEPGSFDLTKVRDTRLPGVTLFMVLPGPEDPVRCFEDMVEVARALAQDLEGEILDESGSTWSIQRERYIREELIRYRMQHPQR
ncbi:MAG: cell division protein ZipA [Gammaproteobacteria bacterium]|nr:cell division protein ZipA [Gammaproteobacteria bacterium]